MTWSASCDRFEIGAGSERGRDLARRAIEASTEVGHTARSFEAGGASDHASFSGAGVPAIMLHWRDDPNYHQPTDTADRLDPEKLAISARTVARLVERLLAS